MSESNGLAFLGMMIVDPGKISEAEISSNEGMDFDLFFIVRRFVI